MSTAVATEPEAIRIPVRKVRHDLQVSLGILIGGLGVAAAWIGLVATGALLPNYAGQPGAFILLQALPGVASTLILIGAIFAAINWSLLRRRRLATRA